LRIATTVGLAVTLGAQQSLGEDMSGKLRIVMIVAIALSGTRLAGAETEEGRQACTNDAFQFCSEVMPDRERVFRCLEARKSQISAACRANMPAEPAPQRAATKKLALTKTGERKAPVRKTLSHASERSVLKKHAPPTKSATHKTLSAKRAANSTSPADPKPLNLVPAKAR
jgi:hypothetical protein